MPANVKCPTCRAVQSKPVAYGVTVECQECGEPFALPAPAPPPPAAAPPPPAAESAFDFSGRKPGPDEDAPPPPRRKLTRTEQEQFANRNRSKLIAFAFVMGIGILIVVGAFVLNSLGLLGKRKPKADPDPPPVQPQPNQPLPKFVPPEPKPDPKPKEPDPEDNTPGPPLAPFEEPVIPYKSGTQVKVREVRAVPQPDLPPLGNGDVYEIAHAPKHDLLFVRSPKWLTVHDLKANRPLETRRGDTGLVRMSLAPDQSRLFAVDQGFRRVHRYDLAARTWTETAVPLAPHQLFAVDGDRFLVMERGSFIKPHLFRWATSDGVKVKQLSAEGGGSDGTLAYNPRNGRIYFGEHPPSNTEIKTHAIDGNKMKLQPLTKRWEVREEAGGTVVLSIDGSRLYYGQFQLDPETLSRVRVFPEPIAAASRDVAFGVRAYYRADAGEKLGEYGFRTTDVDAGQVRNGIHAPAVSVSPDGKSVWVLDLDKAVARQYALEGEE